MRALKAQIQNFVPESQSIGKVHHPLQDECLKFRVQEHVYILSSR